MLNETVERQVERMLCVFTGEPVQFVDGRDWVRVEVSDGVFVRACEAIDAGREKFVWHEWRCDLQPQEAWEALATHEVIPREWVDGSTVFFECPRCEGSGVDPHNCPCILCESTGLNSPYGWMPYPLTLADVVLFACDPRLVMQAMGLVTQQSSGAFRAPYHWSAGTEATKSRLEKLPWHVARDVPFVRYGQLGNRLALTLDPLILER